jgi:hypothetical protein
MKNIAASVRARLSNLSRSTRKPNLLDIICGVLPLKVIGEPDLRRCHKLGWFALFAQD